MQAIYGSQLKLDQQLQYNEEAYIMQLDREQDYVRGELRYYIKAGDATVILGELMDITKSEDIVDVLRAHVDYDGDERYIRPVIGYSFSRVDDSGTTINNVESALSEDKTYGTLTYSVNYQQEDTCRELMDYIKQWVEQQNAAYQAQYGPYAFAQLEDQIRDAGDAGLTSAQSDAMSAAGELQTTIDEALDELDDDQLLYYTTNFLQEEEETGLSSTVKWIVLGALLGGVCWGAYWVVAYLAGGTVRQIDTLTEQYKLPLVGRIENTSGKRKKGLDGAIRRWEDGRKPAACTVQYLSSALALLPGRDIVLCQTSGDADSSALVEELKRQSAKPVYSGTLHTDAQTLQAGKEAGGIFLLVTLEKTRLEELKAELRACKLHDLQVLGVVVLG